MPITWPSRVNDQKPIVADLFARLLEIEQVSLVGTYIGTTAPVLANFQTALEYVLGEGASLPVDAKVQWFDPSLDTAGAIRNLYSKLDDLGVGLSSHEIYPLVPRLAPYGWQLIHFEHVLDDAGVEFTVDLTNYLGELIAFVFSTRNTDNAETAETFLRINGNSGAVYTSQFWNYNEAAWIADQNFDQTRWILNSPGIQSDPIQAGTAFGLLSSLGHVNSYANFLAINIAFDDDPPGAGDRVARIHTGVYETAGQITSVTIGPSAGNWRRGSCIAVYRFIDSDLVTA